MVVFKRWCAFVVVPILDITFWRTTVPKSSLSPAEKRHCMTWCSHGPNMEHSRDTFFSLFHHLFKIVNKPLESTPLVGTSIDPVTQIRHPETISQNSQTIRHTKNTGHEWLVQLIFISSFMWVQFGGTFPAPSSLPDLQMYYWTLSVLCFDLFPQTPNKIFQTGTKQRWCLVIVATPIKVVASWRVWLSNNMYLWF